MIATGRTGGQKKNREHTLSTVLLRLLVRELPVSLLVAILPQFLLPFMSRYFFAFSFASAGHKHSPLSNWVDSMQIARLPVNHLARFFTSRRTDPRHTVDARRR